MGRRSGALRNRYEPAVNRFNRWRRAGHWARILQAVSEAYEGDIQMIHSSPIRVHQHGANGPNKGADPSSGKMIPRIILSSFGPWVVRAAA